MKHIKHFLIATTLFISTYTFAQAPEKMSYQAIVRNAANTLVTNQPVGMQISILQGSATGTAVYVETQSPTSNANGLVTTEIGGGTVVSGNMATINWANGPFYIKTETDPTGGTSYTITGTSQLLSAPYALYAKTSGSSAPGPVGATGLTGATGPQGPIGLTGAQGIQGEVGPQGTQGPIGQTGAAGAAGPQGIAGTNGTNGQGVPTGGAANQVLAKIDGTNFNTTWVTPSGADNLGNHTATQALNMNSNAITGATNITATGTATLGGNAYPTNTGTNGQVLRTNGAGALSWGSNGASLQLSVSKSAAAAQTTSAGSSLVLPDVVTFDNVATSPSVGTWTGNNTFTVGAGGAGLYLIDVSLISSFTFGAPMIDINNAGNSGTSIYGTGSNLSVTGQAPHKQRGHLTTIVNLNVGDFFSIRCTPSSSVIGVDLSTNGSTFLRIVKLN